MPLGVYISMKDYSELVADQVEKAIWENEGPMMDGDTLSCTIDGVTVSGEVAVSPILISVKLRMPELELYNTDAISFRSPDIFTTERSSKAPCCSLGFRRLKMLLIEAYEAYKTLISSKNLLFARLPMWIIYEKQSKIRENELRSKKSLLKAAFKRGEIAQKEYMREVGSIKNSLSAEDISRDRYFMQLYDDIISSCRISPYTIKTAILELMEA